MGIHLQILSFLLLKVQKTLLLSSLLLQGLETSFPVHSPGEWLSFGRITSDNSDSDSGIMDFLAIEQSSPYYRQIVFNA